jgi:hypothetical protein
MLPAITATALAITLNGRPITPPPQALVVDGRTFVPVRALGQALDAGIDYRPATHDVIVSRTGRRVVLHALRTVNGRAYAPLRVAADAFGIDVAYSASGRTIALTTPPNIPSYARRSDTARAALVTPKFPLPDAQIPDAYPAISALIAPQGGPTVNPSAIRLHVDDSDVTTNSTVIGDQIVYTPRTPLANGVHTVHVDGVDRDGVPFTGDWSFTSNYSPPNMTSTPSDAALNSVYLDRTLGAGDRYFNVIAYGPPGGYGYVTIDGVPGIYNFSPQGIGRYVANVTLPLGIDQPFARANVHYTSANGQVTNYTLPTTFQVFTIYPSRLSAPAIVAPPAPGPTLDPGIPKRGVIRPTPAPVASRVPLSTESASPVPTASPSPSPTATPLTHKRRLLSTPHPIPTLAPKPVASP